MFGVGVVELKIIESSIACDYQDYMVIQLNFFWTSLPDALGTTTKFCFVLHCRIYQVEGADKGKREDTPQLLYNVQRSLH